MLTGWVAGVADPMWRSPSSRSGHLTWQFSKPKSYDRANFQIFLQLTVKVCFMAKQNLWNRVQTRQKNLKKKCQNASCLKFERNGDSTKTKMDLFGYAYWWIEGRSLKLLNYKALEVAFGAKPQDFQPKDSLHFMFKCISAFLYTYRDFLGYSLALGTHHDCRVIFDASLNQS